MTPTTSRRTTNEVERMLSLRLGACATALGVVLGLAACEPAPEDANDPDAASDATSEVRDALASDEGTPDGTTSPLDVPLPEDADVPVPDVGGADADDATPDDAADAPDDVPGDVPTLTDAAPAVACSITPALFFGDLALADRAGISLVPVRADAAARPLTTWSAQPTSVSAPVVTAGSDLDGSLVLVATREADTCTLRAFGADLPGILDATRWSLPVDLSGLGGLAADAACASPIIIKVSGHASRSALWTVGNELVEVDLDLGTAVTRITLPAPATAIVPLDPALTISGGGSHWLVGSQGRLDVVTRDVDGLRLGLSLAIPDDALLGPADVAAITPIDSGVLAVLTRHAPEAGLGSRIRLVTASFLLPAGLEVTKLEPLGEAIVLPSAVLTSPVSLGCGVVAGGGSHWWCPGGQLIVAGDGWLRAFDAPSGNLAWEQVDGFRYSGVTATGDGRVAGGGSHWLPQPDWELRAVGAEGVEVLAHEVLPADAALDQSRCVASPILDGDGLVATVLVSAAGVTPVRVPSDLLALGDGWSRVSGNATGAGLFDDGACADGRRRGLIRLASVSATIHTFASQNGFGVAAGVTDDGARPWLGWFSSDGSLFDELVPLPAGATTGSPIEHVTIHGKFAWVAFTVPTEGAGRALVVNGWLRRVHLVSGEMVEPLLDGERIVGLDTTGLGIARVLVEGPGGSRLFVVTPNAGGALFASASGAPQGAVGFGDGPDDGHLAWGPYDDGEDGAFVRIYANDLSVRGLIALSEPGKIVRATAAAPNPAGEVLVALTVTDPATGVVSGRLSRHDGDGLFIDAVDLGTFVPTDLAVNQDGAVLLLDPSLRTRRVVPGVGVGPVREVLARAALGLGDPTSVARLVPDEERHVLFLAGSRAAAPSERAAGQLELDPEGFSTCAEASYCLLSPSCLPSAACRVSGCEPSTGTCVESALASPSCP